MGHPAPCVRLTGRGGSLQALSERDGIATVGRKLRLLPGTCANRLSLSFVYRRLSVNVVDIAGRTFRRDWGVIMRTKVITAAAVLAISVGVFVAMRGENRADAAAGNCYASAQGPSAPTICE